MNNYLLSYSPFQNDPAPWRIVEFIRSNTYTYQYLVPFPGSIVVKSNATLNEMIQSYRPFLQPNDFMLTQVTSSYISGMLPGSYWTWLNSDIPPPLPGPVQ